MSVESPFIRIGSRSSARSAWAMLALMVPATIYSILYETPFIWKMLGYAVLGMMAESIYTLIIKRKRRLFCMGSGFSAALLAASVPPSMPFIPMLFAIIFMIWIVKLPMVGLPLRFNTAMAGRLFLMLLYPAQTVNWGTATADVISTATPQELYHSEGFMIAWPRLLFGKIDGIWEDLFLLVPGSPGETFPLIILMLGIILCWKGIIAWRSPAVFLLSFFLTTWMCGNHPLFNLFSAATMFSAVFILSDPVSSPMSKSGQVFFGLAVGISNALIRHYTYYTEAIVYAVLIANLLSPFMDRLAFEFRSFQLNRRAISG